MAQLSLTLLGAFQVQLDGQPLTGFQSDKARALLAYLALEADRPQRRSYLAALFWPDWPEQTALAYLRHALANLRKILGDRTATTPFLLATPTTLQFNQASDYQLDVMNVPYDLPSVIAPSADIIRCQRAAAAYHGPLLQGFYLDNCAEFEEWLLLTREQMQRRALATLRVLTEYYAQLGDLAQALHYAQQRLALEPWLEDVHRQVMVWLAQSGQRSAALAQFERCRHALVEELSIEPSAETIALYEAIRAGSYAKVLSREERGVSPQTGGERVTQLLNENLRQLPKGSTATSMELARKRALGPDTEHRDPILSLPQHNLPAPTTPLLGRARELRDLQRLLQRTDVRLVTLTGPGGVGKTRLGLAVAHAALPHFHDGVFVVQLAAIREAALVITAIAQTLAISEKGTLDLLTQVEVALRNRNLLLLLDNFEQVLQAAPFVAQLLAACSGLKVLVTSRERLALQGEHEYVTPPLPTPSDDVLADILAESISQGEFAAVELFCQRAQAVRHDFVLTTANAPAIAAICRRLDGLPLAIELAAAWSKLFAPTALLRRLTTSNGQTALHFLKTDNRDVPGRQRSLWETVAWSYALLTAHEQALFRRLAIFVGSVTLEAIAAVCHEDLPLDILEGMTSLVDKHLVQQEFQPNGEPAFVLLETMREFGLARLRAEKELLLATRHANFYVALMNALGPRLYTADSADCLRQIRHAYVNIRIALQWLLKQQLVKPSLQLCDQLLHYWAVEYSSEATSVLQTTLALAANEPPSGLHVNVLASAGYMATRAGDRDGARYYSEQALAMYRATNNAGTPKQVAMAHAMLAAIMFELGDYVAEHAHRTAEAEIATAANDTWALAMCLSNQGITAARLGEFERADRLHQKAVALHRQHGEPWGLTVALGNQAVAYILQRDYEKAWSTLKEGERIAQSIQAIDRLMAIHHGFALVAIGRHQHDSAASHLPQVLSYYLERGNPYYHVAVLMTAVQFANQQHHFVVTFTLASAISHYYKESGYVAPPLEQQALNEAVATARTQLDPAAATEAWRTGSAMTLDEAVTYALDHIVTAHP